MTVEKDVQDLKAVVGRIDERTEFILEGQQKQSESLVLHEDHDRQDFKEVHHRINSLERKQNWIVGLGTAVVFFVSVGAAIVKTIFGL